MVQISGDHQLRLVVYSIIYRVFDQVVSRISEPSTVAMENPTILMVFTRISMGICMGYISLLDGNILGKI